MPRAPQSSALFAGRPLANRSVFSIRMSRIRSMPLSRPRSTRLTRGTGANRPLGCHTKASAAANESSASGAGDPADSCAAMLSSARAIRSAPSFGDEDGRFAAAEADLAEPTFEAPRAAVFRGLFDILGFPCDAPISGLERDRKRRK